MHTAVIAPLPSRLQVPFNLCHKPGKLLRLVRVGGLHIKYVSQGRCIG